MHRGRLGLRGGVTLAVLTGCASFGGMRLPGSKDTGENKISLLSEVHPSPIFIKQKSDIVGCRGCYFREKYSSERKKTILSFLLTSLFCSMVQAPTMQFFHLVNIELGGRQHVKKFFLFSFCIFRSRQRHILGLAHFVTTAGVTFSRGFSFPQCIVHFRKLEHRISFSRSTPVDCYTGTIVAMKHVGGRRLCMITAR